MAISGSDGSIVLSTKVDTSGISQGMGSVKSIVSKVGDTMAAAFSIRMINAFAKETKELYKIQMQNEVKLATVMRQRMKATDDQIKSMFELASAQQQIGIIGDEVQLAGLQQIATFATQKETIETLLPAMNNLIAQQYGYEASAESARNAANLIGKVLQGQTGALTRVGITFSETEEQMLKTGNEMERAAVLAQVITNNVGQMNTALAQTDVGRQQQLANTFGDIKEQFGAAFTQLAVLLLPALRALANLLAFIASIARAAAQGIANLFGAKTTDNSSSLANNMQTISGGASSAADNMEDVADATKKAGKEAKKVTASFDDLQILTSNAGGGDAGAGADTSGIEAALGGGEIGTGFDFGIQDKIAEIDASMAMLMGIIGASLAALGLYLLFMGNIPWGVGLIIAGIAVFGVSAFALAGQEDVSQNAANALSALMGIIGGALIAIGVVLIMLGSTAWGIGFIIAGAAALGVGIATIVKFGTDDIEQTIMYIQGIAAGALLALGIMLLVFNGANPLSIGLIIAGAALLAITVAQIAAGEAEAETARVIHSIVAIASAALLALGIILLFTPASWGLAVGLIVAGAVGLASEAALNWDSIVTTLQGKIGAITAIVSAALLVLGIIFIVTGVGIPLGIGLLLAGAAGLATVVAINWDFIVDKVKEIWDKVKNFWNTYIAPIFTAKWWTDLGKKALNGLISVFEKGINYIIGKINVFVRGIDSVISAVGSIFGADWGVAQIPEVKIPRLAKGAVIPPNREFLAVLGDQKHGTNIEAPAELIKQMAKEAIAEMGFGGQVQREEHYYIGETEVMTLLYRLAKGGERLQGESLVTGGAH